MEILKKEKKFIEEVTAEVTPEELALALGFDQPNARVLNCNRGGEDKFVVEVVYLDDDAQLQGLFEEENTRLEQENKDLKKENEVLRAKLKAEKIPVAAFDEGPPPQFVEDMAVVTAYENEMKTAGEWEDILGTDTYNRFKRLEYLQEVSDAINKELRKERCEGRPGNFIFYEMVRPRPIMPPEKKNGRDEVSV